MKYKHIYNTIINTVRWEVIHQTFDPFFEYYACFTCGGESCNDCGQMFKSKPLHITWHEDVCKECQDAHAAWMDKQTEFDWS